MPEEEFTVWICYPDFHDRVVDHVDAGTAVRRAADLTRSKAIQLLCERVIITDGGDDTVFEWQPSKGVTFPPLGRV